MAKVQMAIEDVLLLIRHAIKNDNASAALGLIQDTLDQLAARQQEVTSDEEETPTSDVE